jgi:serpin B
VLLAALLAAVVLGGPAAVPAASAPAAPAREAALEKEAAQGLNSFGLELYARLRSREGNLFFSPWSVSSALAVAYEGARGSTRKGMATALRFPLGQGSFRESFHRLQGTAGRMDSEHGLTVKAARSLWTGDPRSFTKDYLDQAAGHLSASLFTADFARDPEEARRRINAWVRAETGGLIEALFEKGALTAGTKIVIADALYFSGLWSLPFDPRQTWKEPFHREGRPDVSVPMMHRQGSYRVRDLKGLSMIELPCGKGEVSMIVLLPDRGSRLKAVEERLSPKTLASWTDGLMASEHGEVALTLPRFSVSFGGELTAELLAMGMGSAFSPDADFSGMTGRKGLFISTVAHKARIEVDEKGARAAAAGGVAMSKGVRESRMFIVDRPFVYLVRENRSGAILFMGRVMEPGS